MTVNRMSVAVLVLSDRNASVAQVSVERYDEDGLFVVQATGSAKREPGDLRDDSIAEDLAVGRALVKLGRKLQANGTIRVRRAAAEKEKADERRVVNKLKGMRPVPARQMLPVEEIEAEWGPQAAERARARRERKGRSRKTAARGH